MIIQEQKPFDEILQSLEGEEKIFLVGCNLCATTCQVGGEDQLKEMEGKLKEKGKSITGWIVLDPACQAVEVKKKFRERKEEIEEADSILVMACGGGAQSVRENAERIKINKIVHPGVNTLFQGEIIRGGHFEERCSLCSECVLEQTGTICPLTRCTKGLLNGPCGGSSNGKCEVDPERDCGWDLIYKRLKEIGQLEKMSEIREAKDYSKLMRPRKLILEGDKK